MAAQLLLQLAVIASPAIDVKLWCLQVTPNKSDALIVTVLNQLVNQPQP